MPTAATQRLAFAIADSGSQLRLVKQHRKSPAQLQRGVGPCVLDQSPYKAGYSAFVALVAMYTIWEWLLKTYTAWLWNETVMYLPRMKRGREIDIYFTDSHPLLSKILNTNPTHFISSQVIGLAFNYT